MAKGAGAPKLAQYWDDKKQDGRAYKHPITGHRVPSVTSITGLEDKSGALTQWSVNLTLAFAAKNWQDFGRMSETDVMRRGRYRHKDVLNERAQIGTDAHAWAEADLLGEWEYPEVEGEALECVWQWQDFRKHHEVDPVHVEVTAWSHKDDWAGTMDLTGYIDGVLTLADLKTSKGLYDSHRMQLAALANADVLMIEKPDGSYDEIEPPKYEQFSFIHLRPDYYDPMKEVTIPAYWELVHMDPDEIPSLYKQFMGYRNAWEGQRELKTLRKKKEEEAKNTW